jgi:nucleoside-diphosphate-sugar epimerase
MILFTGSGALAEEYKKQFACKIISARHLSDDELESHIIDCSVVIHNSANISCKTFEEAIRDNFLLTRRIIDMVHRVKPEVIFIYISSMSLLKTGDSYKEIEEMSVYAFSKYLGEIYCLKHDHQRVSAVRFSTIFYHHPAKDGLSKLIHEAQHKGEITIYNDGGAKRDFIPIEIAVRYLNKLAFSLDIPKRINIASGSPVSFQHIVSYLSGKFPQLKINNVSIPEPPEVLSKFSKPHLKICGEIEFSLQDSMEKYVKELAG